MNSSGERLHWNSKKNDDALAHLIEVRRCDGGSWEHQREIEKGTCIYKVGQGEPRG
jgi:hypothetical protein